MIWLCTLQYICMYDLSCLEDHQRTKKLMPQSSPINLYHYNHQILWQFYPRWNWRLPYTGEYYFPLLSQAIRSLRVIPTIKVFLLPICPQVSWYRTCVIIAPWENTPILFWFLYLVVKYLWSFLARFDAMKRLESERVPASGDVGRQISGTCIECTENVHTILNLHTVYVGCLVGYIEDLRRFSGMSAISRLGSRK